MLRVWLQKQLLIKLKCVLVSKMRSNYVTHPIQNMIFKPEWFCKMLHMGLKEQKEHYCFDPLHTFGRSKAGYFSTAKAKVINDVCALYAATKHIKNTECTGKGVSRVSWTQTAGFVKVVILWFTGLSAVQLFYMLILVPWLQFQTPTDLNKS